LGWKRENRVQVQIRSATTEDIASIALLCQELGYSTSEQDVQKRLKRFEQDAERVVYVAYLPNESIVGWVHVYISESLLTGRRAEIDGLIVNELDRSCGAGRLLMQSVEQWAKQQGCDSVYVY
jgi:N-acetylglutamate synthase-like GNAT family acetyltransferase